VVRQRDDDDDDDEAPEREPGDDERPDHGSGYATRMLAEDIPSDVGHRNPAAGAIVGMLARPRACPDDFVNACMMLVVDASAADFERSPDHRRQVESEAARWRHLLTRGPRDEEFAAEVLGAWIRVRDQTRAPWSEAKARDVARSLWKTCARREADEGEEAGAEDYGVGPRLSVRPPLHPPAPADEVVSAAPPTDHHPDEKDQSALPYPPPSPEVAAAVVTASRIDVVGSPKWRGGIDPRTYVHAGGATYGKADRDRDLARAPIPIDFVMPAMDFVTNRPLLPDPDSLKKPVQHGWGEYFGRFLGGMSAGDFRVIGAGSAGAGKTWFECWLIHGLALQTACRLLGVKGYETRPIVLPIWLTEMPRKGELYTRMVVSHLGCPAAVFTHGSAAHDAPGVRRHAELLGWTPHEVVRHARESEEKFGHDDRFPMCVAWNRVTHVMRLSDLPRRSRKSGVVINHRAGPELIDHFADAVEVFREDLAREAGISVDQVLPVAVIDPGQRFTGEGKSETQAIDHLFGAIDEVLCNELGCSVVATSDTTKAAAREVSIEKFLSDPAETVGADIYGGSYKIMHHASDALAICSEKASVPNARCVRTWIRSVKGRDSGAAEEAFPFEWERALGRYVGEKPEPLRAPPDRADHGHHQQRGHDRPARGPRDFIPPGTDRILHD
jgi:hypothetical protein